MEPTPPRIRYLSRNDWLELTGMEMPTTMAELNEYLYKIKELDPYGNGETIPLILEKGGSTEVLNTRNPFCWAVL